MAVLLAAALAAPPAPAAPDEPYVVVLVDGTVIRAQGPPRVQGELAWILHAGSGIPFAVPAARVDFGVTERLNHLTRTSGVPPPLGPAVSGGRPAGTAPPAPAIEPAEDYLARDAAVTAFSRKLGDLQEERDRLRAEERDLAEQRRALERDIRWYARSPRMASALGSKLKDVRLAGERNARNLEEVEAGIRDIFQIAAERGIPIRQVVQP